MLLDLDQNLTYLVAQASAATFSGAAVNTSRARAICFQVSWTADGDSAGAVTVQISNDGVVWAVYPDSSATVTATTAGSAVVEVANCVAKYYRLTYTRSSGTGAIFNANYVLRS